MRAELHNGLELAQQEALLDSTATQLQLVLQQRAQYEHAIAVLTGKPASTFSLAEAPFECQSSTDSASEFLLKFSSGVPTWLPASAIWLLKMRRLAVAMAAFYPHITSGRQRRMAKPRHRHPAQRSKRLLVDRRRFAATDRERRS